MSRRVGTYALPLVAAAFVVAPAVSPLAAQSPASHLDSIFAFAKGVTPGCAVAAFRNGAVEFIRGYGMADLEHDIVIAPNTPFYMASVSKQFTAAAVNLLVLDGKISYDDDVRKYVPELPAYETPITIRHLLNHTSGLRDYLSLFGLSGLNEFPITNADFLAMVSRQRALNFRPGDQYSYSNTGYVLLSIVIERVSGKPLRTFAQERIFGPLGMTSTQFRDRHNMLVSRRALAYAPAVGGGFTMSVPYFDVVGDGGLFSTVEDLARWEGNFWEPRIGGTEWLKLENARGRLNDGTPIAYGAGLAHGTYRGEPTVEHGGSLGGYNIDLLRFPATRFSVAILCNSNAVPSGQLARLVAETYLSDILARGTTAVAPSPSTAPSGKSPLTALMLSRYSGVFFDDRTMQVRQLAVEDGRLYLRPGPTNRGELVPLTTDRFQVPGTQTVLVVSPAADAIRLETPGSSPVVARRVPTVDHPDLRSYAGLYASSELRVEWNVSAGDSAVTLTPARGPSVRLTPAFEDAFTSPSGFVRFIRDDKGQVVAMDVSAGERVRNVRFDRKRP